MDGKYKDKLRPEERIAKGKKDRKINYKFKRMKYIHKIYAKIIKRENKERKGIGKERKMHPNRGDVGIYSNGLCHDQMKMKVLRELFEKR